jgi:hypothetical protein
MNRIADRVDLAIDALTLGQYGLEQVAGADAAGCEAIGRQAGWESPQRPARRRGGCEPAQLSWDWPASACRAS